MSSSLLLSCDAFTKQSRKTGGKIQIRNLTLHAVQNRMVQGTKRAPLALVQVGFVALGRRRKTALCTTSLESSPSSVLRRDWPFTSRRYLPQSVETRVRRDLFDGNIIVYPSPMGKSAYWWCGEKFSQPALCDVEIVGRNASTSFSFLLFVATVSVRSFFPAKALAGPSPWYSNRSIRKTGAHSTFLQIFTLMLKVSEFGLETVWL